MSVVNAHTLNRQKLFKTATVDCVIVAAAGQLQRNSDVAYPFRQDSSFLYLTGCNIPDLVLVITQNKHYILLPKRESHRDIWEGSLPVAEIIAASGVDQVLSYQDGWELINQHVNAKRIGVIHPPKNFLGAFGMYTNPTRKVLFSSLKRRRPAEIVDIRPLIAKQRSIKSKQEIDTIKKAIDITAESLNAVMRGRHEAKFEYDLEHKLTYEFMQRGANGHAFSPIIASDKNAAIVHNINNSSPLKNAHMILFDIGAEVSGYAADVSRVYALQKPTCRQVQLFNAVYDVQQQIMQLARPGVTILELEQKTQTLLSSKLPALNLCKPIKHYYPHGVSHHLGLDVHDTADYHMPLQKNMVITIEPGLYIPEESIGIRIEDDILITDTEPKNLSANIPHDLLYYL